MLKILAILAVLFACSGCGGSARAIVTELNDSGHHFSTIEIQEDPSGVTFLVNPDCRLAFESRLRSRLFQEGRFREGPGLKIVYRFEHTNPGARALRWFVGLGAGKGEIVMSVNFLDPKGLMLSRLSITGNVTGGMWGGSYSKAFEYSADEIAKHVIRLYSSSP